MSNVSYEISNPSSTSESSVAGIFVSIRAIPTEFIVPIRFFIIIMTLQSSLMQKKGIDAAHGTSKDYGEFVCWRLPTKL